MHPNNPTPDEGHEVITQEELWTAAIFIGVGLFLLALGTIGQVLTPTFYEWYRKWSKHRERRRRFEEEQRADDYVRAKEVEGTMKPTKDPKSWKLWVWQKR